MNEKIVKLENLFEDITNVQEEIKIKTKLRNEYIMAHANPVFEEITDKINKWIKLIDNVFPLDKLATTIMWSGNMKSKIINNNKYEIFVMFDFKKKNFEVSYRKVEAGALRNRFALKITEKETWIKEEQDGAYSLTCSKFINIFGNIENQYVICDIFKDIIQDIVTALTHKLQELKEKSISIIIPQLEKTQVDNSKIILGEFDNYQIILKKK